MSEKKKGCKDCPEEETDAASRAPEGVAKAGAGKALVTGAGGFVGRRLCQALHDRGVGVRALVRDSRHDQFFQSLGAQICVGDLTDPEVAPWAVDGVDGVFHLASIVQGQELDDADFWDVNYSATKRLLHAAKRTGVKRFLHCSTTGVMGNITNPPADETAPYNTEDIYQITKAEAEKLALEFGAAHGMEVTVVRPGAVYGPGDGRLLKLFRMAGGGRFPIIGDGATLIHPVYVDDLVEGMILAYEKPEAAGRVYILCGEAPVSVRHWAEVIAQAAGGKLRSVTVPYLPVLLAAAIMEATLVPIGIKPPLFGRRVDFYIKTRAFSIARAREELGYSPAVGLEDGAARTLAWYREHGLISCP